MTTMIGEALNRRSDLQKRIAQLQDRLSACVVVQEDEQPPEDPQELLTELGGLCDELQELIAKINHTNAMSRLRPGRPSPRDSPVATRSRCAKVPFVPRSPRRRAGRSASD